MDYKDGKAAKELLRHYAYDGKAYLNSIAVAFSGLIQDRCIAV